MKITFVVHRYAPFPGGSEYYVQQMAEECASRGHDVIVFAGEHKGNYNGITVNTDGMSLMNRDLVIVHGGGVPLQDMVLSNAKNINSPMVFMLIIPTFSPLYLQAIQDVAYIGCSTLEDWEYVNKLELYYKARQFRHGLNPKYAMGQKGLFKDRFGIPKDKKMFLSCGGYWPNKRMKELNNLFNKANPEDSILVTTGYDNRYGIMPQDTDKTINIILDNPDDVKNAIADADCYIMHSDREGFGLVIIEAMMNKTPWMATEIAGAKLLKDFGKTYTTDEELIGYIKNFNSLEFDTERGYHYIMRNHHIKNTVDDIERIPT